MLAFILGDAINSGSSFFNLKHNKVAVIEGNDITPDQYQAAIDQATEALKIEYSNNDFDEDATAQIREQVWQMILLDNLLNTEANKIGMAVTNDELTDLCMGENPSPVIAGRRMFADEKGQFSRQNLNQFLNYIQQDVDDEDETKAQQAGQIEQLKSYWLYWEKATRLTQMQQKYTTLVQGLVRPNSLDAEFAFEAKNKMANVQYVMQPYTAIADSTIEVSAGEIKSLYKERKKLYRQKPNRAISYISFEIVPSEEDFAQAKKELEALAEEFKTTDNVALVVNPNSDIRFDEQQDYSEVTIPEQYKDFAFGPAAHVGATTELTLTDGTYSMARIMKCGYYTPDSVKLTLKAAADTLEDGESTWYRLETLPKEVKEPALKTMRGGSFTAKIGTNEMTFVLDSATRATRKAQVAILERKVYASNKTTNAIYQQAKQYVVNHNTEEDFTEAAKQEAKMLVPQANLLATTPKIGQIKGSRDIVRWAFRTDNEGTVSDVFDCGDQYVVAVLTEINDGDYRSVESADAELRAELIKRKKAEQMKASLASVKTLDEAAKIAGTAVAQADSISMASYTFGNAGMEPAALGAALTTKVNTLSAPVEGNQGVFVIRPTATFKGDAKFDKKAEINQLNQRYGYAAYQVLNLLEMNAKIKDNRGNFQ